MRTVNHVVASCGLGLVLASVGCSDGDADPTDDATSSGESGGSSSDGDASADVGMTAVDDSTTTLEPATTDDGTSTGEASEGDSGDSSSTTGPAVVEIPEGLQLPFVCGDKWRLDTWGHAPALDMVREPDQVGTEGAPLLAPGPGTVNQSFYHDNAGNVVQIDHGEGYFTTYLHMESRAVEVGAVVVMGDMIGAVGRTGPTSNNHPHLHFELGLDANGDGEASWGFEGAERVIPWFDGVEYGQANAMTWRDVTSANCP
jgi:murein DD-endopeptidase MepM/ murein hydrolase activator NlpD